MAITRNIHIKVNVGEAEIEGAFPIPITGPKRVVLPVLRSLSHTIQQLSSVSSTCSKGCDACCRQMVPIASTEVHDLAATVDALPPALVQRISRRFDRAITALDAAGILTRLRRRYHLSPADLTQLDRDYFAAQVPCPFLERRSCTIHPNRPLACREFLVSSDPRNCADPGCGKVQRIELSARPSAALIESDGEWVPLVLPREFAAEHREESTDAAKVLTDVLNRL